MSIESPKEAREVLAEVYGSRRGTVIFHIWVAGATAVALTAVGVLVWGVYTKLVQPVLRSITITGKWLPQPASWTDIAVSIAITAVIIALLSTVATLVVRRWYERSRAVEMEILEKFFDQAVFPRIQKLEKHAASVHTVKGSFEAVEEQLREIRTYVQMPDPGTFPPPGGLSTYGSGLGTLGDLIKRIIGVGSVGQITKGD
jgi:hypothetical protein